MKEKFCYYQERVVNYEDDRIIFRCNIYNKECPYKKVSKAEKKCNALDKTKGE